jgi:hypothetical protein
MPQSSPVFASLWVLDRIAGPMPRPLADEISEARRERMGMAFLGLVPEDRNQRN